MNALQAKLEKQLLVSVALKVHDAADELDRPSHDREPETAELEHAERELVDAVQCLRLVIASRKLGRS